MGNESYDIPCTSTLCMTRGPNTVQLEYNPKQGIAESILRPKKHHRTILAKAMYGYVWRNKWWGRWEQPNKHVRFNLQPTYHRWVEEDMAATQLRKSVSFDTSVEAPPRKQIYVAIFRRTL